jgi:hypothetical protein
VTTRQPGIAFFPAHPSQLWMLRPVAEELADEARVYWVLRDKDCMVDLARAFGLKSTVISQAGRGLWRNAVEFAADLWRSHRYGKARDIDVWVTKYGAANMAAWLGRRRSISFNDDDADIVPLIAWTSYPFAHALLAPTTTRMGRFDQRTLRYPSFHELFYLHPKRFTPDPAIFNELGVQDGAPFGICRLSALQAHHDAGIRGIGTLLLREVLALAEAQKPAVRVFITSEAPLDAEFEPYRIAIPPERIHHALAAADFFVGDSQTMTAEAAVLGTPAFRVSSFVGRISYIADLESYGLAYGFQPDDREALLRELAAVLGRSDRDAVFAERRARMLEDKADPVPLFADVIREIAAGREVTPAEMQSRVEDALAG